MPNLKVLLVEDDELNQIMLTKRLTKRGFTVTLAVDGQLAIDKAKEEHPDVILMDLRVPVIDGCEATRRLKADSDTQHIPIIALTADAMVGDKEKALAAGCDAYQEKPVRLEKLLETMQSLMNQSSES